MWISIIKTLMKNHTKFNPADRASLIDDAFSLCDAGEVDASIPLELSLYLVNERDYAPWATALRYLNFWKDRLAESAAYKKYILFFKQLMDPITRYIGWEDEGSHLKKYSIAFRISCLCFVRERYSMALTQRTGHYSKFCYLNADY